LSDRPHNDVRRGLSKLGRFKTREIGWERKKTQEKYSPLKCGIHMSRLVKEVRGKNGIHL
jgi:hypothetical protein